MSILLALTRVVARLLFSVEPTDPMTAVRADQSGLPIGVV